MEPANQGISVAGLVPAVRSSGFKMIRMHFRIWGPKVGRFVDLYGAGERALFLRYEGLSSTRTYCEHAPSLDEYVNGRRLRHIFTFAVLYADGVESLIDLVRKKDLVPDDAGDLKPEQWKDKDDWAQQHGFRYEFITETDKSLKNSAHIENWAQILPYVQSGLRKNNVALRERVAGAIRSREVLLISDLPRVFPAEQPDELHDALFVLLHTGHIRIDLTQGAINRTFRVDPNDDTAQSN